MNAFGLLENSPLVLRFEVVFPSHCHQEGDLAPSAVISLEEVLEEVRKTIG